MSKNYIPVLCCSSKKTKDTFCYNGQSIKFVASPRMAAQNGVIFHKPDDKIPGGNTTWRDLVWEQNHPDLVPAYLLYKRDIYRDLYHEFGNHFYILSAGWGLIRADFKIPAYDITYSTAPNVPEYARRIYNEQTFNNRWEDINHLKTDSRDFDPGSEIILFAPSDYVIPYCRLTQFVPYRKKILFRSKKVIEAILMQKSNFDFEYYQTGRTRTWVYEAAENFLNEYTKTNPVVPNNNVTFWQAFSYFGFQTPPRNQKELQRAYQEMVKKCHDDTKEITAIYIKALEYFN